MDTLRNVCFQSRASLGYRCLVSMDRPFFDYLHHRVVAPPSVAPHTSSSAVVASHVLDFSDLLGHFTRAASMPNDVSLRTTQPHTFCSEPIEIAKSVVINGSDSGFMGPLCCPITKANAKKILEGGDDSYWVTEKSDGIRVVLVTLLAPQFPRWRLVLAGGAALRDVSLVDTITLESGFSELAAAPSALESSQLRLSFGTHVLRRIPERAGLFHLVLRTSAADAQELSATVVRTLTPRHFTYAFDRSIDAVYLLLEEYPFLNLSCVILDTELVVAEHHHTKRPTLLLAAFDVYAFKDAETDLDSFVMPGAGGERSAKRFDVSELTLLNRSPMSRRLHVMSAVVFAPMELAITSGTFHPVSVPILMKQMVKVSDLPTALFPLLRRGVVKKGASGVDGDGDGDGSQLETYFEGYGEIGLTKNDGFIFTPENFDIISGSQPLQLKWKWPEMLTLDWRVASAARGGPTSQLQPSAGAVGAYEVHLFFKKKRPEGQVDAGHTQYSRSLIMQNAGGIVVPQAATYRHHPSPNDNNKPQQHDDAEGLVVECRLDTATKKWTMLKARNEKTEANSVVTAVSVLESAAEFFDISSLCAALGLDKPLPGSRILEVAGSSSSTSRDQVVPAPRLCKLVVRAVAVRFESTVGLVVQWAAKIPSVRNVIPCNHRKIEECFGLGEPCQELTGSSRLKDKIMIEVANAGGCYAWSNVVCDAFFDGDTGRWGIVRLHSNASSNDCFFTNVMDHLIDVAHYRAVKGEFPPFPEGLNRPDERVEAARTGAAWERALEVETNAHYADRARHLSSGKQQRSNLRRMNNFVKSVLIQSGHKLLHHADGCKLTVLDMCCGRGGDLLKWRAHQPSFLLMVDSCFEAVAEAASRYNISSGLSTKIVQGKEGHPGVPAAFYVRDCFERDGFRCMLNEVRETRLQPVHDNSKHKNSSANLATKGEVVTAAKGGFDMVSCQFSMHYGFKDEQHVRAFLENVVDALRPGGVFIGTTVDDRNLLEHRRKRGDRFGNSIYEVEFLVGSGSAASGTYGEAYRISVEHSVESQVEYVVHWAPFVALAESYGLTCLEANNFADTYNDFVTTEVGQRLLSLAVKETGGGGGDDESRSGAVKRNSAGQLEMSLDDDEREACYLFRSFVFRKL